MLAHRYPHVRAALTALLLAVLAALAVNTPSADGAARSFPHADRMIALTFDDGPDPRYTPAVLDILATHEAKATFFVVGEHAERHPEIIARILREGHEIAHHTHTHPHVERLDEEDLACEFDDCLAILEAQGVAPAWYRPPRKRLTPAQERLAAERGMRVVLWARTFERARFSDAAELAGTLIAETREGDIVLAHDGLLDRSMTLEALPHYLVGMRRRGIAVVTVSDLEAAHSAKP